MNDLQAQYRNPSPTGRPANEPPLRVGQVDREFNDLRASIAELEQCLSDLSSRLKRVSTPSPAVPLPLKDEPKEVICDFADQIRLARVQVRILIAHTNDVTKALEL